MCEARCGVSELGCSTSQNLVQLAKESTHFQHFSDEISIRYAIVCWPQTGFSK
jgi:hypothetical protein